MIVRGQVPSTRSRGSCRRSRTHWAQWDRSQLSAARSRQGDLWPFLPLRPVTSPRFRFSLGDSREFDPVPASRALRARPPESDRRVVLPSRALDRGSVSRARERRSDRPGMGRCASGGVGVPGSRLRVLRSAGRHGAGPWMPCRLMPCRLVSLVRSNVPNRVVDPWQRCRIDPKRPSSFEVRARVVAPARSRGLPSRSQAERSRSRR